MGNDFDYGALVHALRLLAAGISNAFNKRHYCDFDRSGDSDERSHSPARKRYLYGDYLDDAAKENYAGVTAKPEG